MAVCYLWSCLLVKSKQSVIKNKYDEWQRKQFIFKIILKGW